MGDISSGLNSLMSQLNSLFAGPGTTPQGQSAANAGAAAARGNLQTLGNLFPGVLNAATATAAQLNEMLSAQTINHMNRIAPGWQQMMQTTVAGPTEVRNFVSNFLTTTYPEAVTNLKKMGNTASGQADQMMKGRVPTDVLQMVRNASAEKGIAGLGQSGGSVAGSGSRNLMARDLGLSSLDVMAKGQQMAGTATGLYKQLESMGSTGANMVGLSTQLGLNASSAIKNLMAPTVDPTSLASNLFNTFANAGTVNPSQVMSSYFQSEQAALNNDMDRRVSLANAMTGLWGKGQEYNTASGLFGGGR